MDTESVLAQLVEEVRKLNGQLSDLPGNWRLPGKAD